jgi:hypothetical protein
MLAAMRRASSRVKRCTAMCRSISAGIREVSAQIGASVADVAYQRGLARGEMPRDISAYVKSQMYEPAYCSYL